MYDTTTVPARLDIARMYLDMEAKEAATAKRANRLSVAVGILLAVCIGLASALAFAVDVALEQKPAVIVIPMSRPAPPAQITFDPLA